jgi:hypothetical protein
MTVTVRCGGTVLHYQDPAAAAADADTFDGAVITLDGQPIGLAELRRVAARQRPLTAHPTRHRIWTR